MGGYNMKIGYWYEVNSDEDGTLQSFNLEMLENKCDNVRCDSLAFSGDVQRELIKLLDELSENDTLVTPTLPRFAQSVEDLFYFMDRLQRKRIAFIVLDWPETEAYEGSMVSQNLLAVSEFQKSMMRAAAQREAVTVRMRGRNGGRPKASSASIAKALKLYERNQLTIAEITERTGVSKSTLYKYISERRANLTKES